MDINATIKFYRKKKGFTQKDLANLLHMDRSTYTKIETGATKLTMDILNRISRLLEIPMKSLIEKSGDYVFETISDSLSMMLHLTQTHLSEKMFRMVPYGELNKDQKKLLKERGFVGKEAYEDTPLKGRVYDFGPTDLRRYMFENCGMDVLFRKKMITDEHWMRQWEEYLKENPMIEIGENYVFPRGREAFDEDYVPKPREIEIDDRIYFVSFIAELNFPGKKSDWVQFAMKDFPGFTDEFDILDCIVNAQGALDGDIMAFTIDGYDPVTPLINLADLSRVK